MTRLLQSWRLEPRTRTGTARKRCSISSFTDSVHERKAVVEPAGDAADHLLHRPAQLGEPDRRPVCAVALRTGAVDDEQRLGRISFERSRGDARVRQIDGAGQVADTKQLRATDVEQDEAARSQRSVNVPAVSLKREKAPEMPQ